MRKCPFNDCEEVIGDHLFACMRHWNSLNLTDRHTIEEAYEAYLDGDDGLVELRKRQQEVLGDRGTA